MVIRPLNRRFLHWSWMCWASFGASSGFTPYLLSSPLVFTCAQAGHASAFVLRIQALALERSCTEGLFRLTDETDVIRKAHLDHDIEWLPLCTLHCIVQLVGELQRAWRCNFMPTAAAANFGMCTADAC